MKKYILPAVKSVLTIIIAGLCIVVAGKLEYWQQLVYVDNLIGWTPFVLLIGITAMLIVLIWKPHKTRLTSTIVLSVLTVLWSALLVPAVTGNWYPLAKEFQVAGQSLLAPAAGSVQTAQLPETGNTGAYCAAAKTGRRDCALSGLHVFCKCRL